MVFFMKLSCKRGVLLVTAILRCDCVVHARYSEVQNIIMRPHPASSHGDGDVVRISSGLEGLRGRTDPRSKAVPADLQLRSARRGLGG